MGQVTPEPQSGAAPPEYTSDAESGYCSSMSDSMTSTATTTTTASEAPAIHFTESHLQHLNKQLQSLEPQEILRWAMITLPGLYQTTAFGLTGLVTIDMLSRLSPGSPSPVELIFLDTLHHFPETLELVERVKARYPGVRVHVVRPQGAGSAAEFEARHGARLWERDEELYDWVAKVEPAQRAYAQLGVQAVFTGRRRSQGARRGDLAVVEVDDAGLVKVNPLANWTFAQVRQYVADHDVPYNALLDRGYKSVGDWHSTQPVAEGEDERAGRWRGKEKTECGIHNPRSRYAQFLQQQQEQAGQAGQQETLTAPVPSSAAVAA